MGVMSLSRIKMFRQALEGEDLSYGEGAEIDAAFEQVPDEQLRDLRENAMYGDMLDELEEMVSPLERAIFDWVEEHFGESEALDPSWDIGALANHLETKFSVKEK